MNHTEIFQALCPDAFMKISVGNFGNAF